MCVLEKGELKCVATCLQCVMSVLKKLCACYWYYLALKALCHDIRAIFSKLVSHVI